MKGRREGSDSDSSAQRRGMMSRIRRTEWCSARSLYSAGQLMGKSSGHRVSALPLSRGFAHNIAREGTGGLPEHLESSAQPDLPTATGE